jgi:hypothetical protein
MKEINDVDVEYMMFLASNQMKFKDDYMKQKEDKHQQYLIKHREYNRLAKIREKEEKEKLKSQ